MVHTRSGFFLFKNDGDTVKFTKSALFVIIIVHIGHITKTGQKEVPNETVNIHYSRPRSADHSDIGKIISPTL